jgi:pimeloyl-ACP methyl ester carboxylesterase
MDSLAAVKSAWSVDERRVVLAGHNAGANMAWRMATREADAWAGVVAFSGEITDQDRSQLKKIAGKPVYLFRGAKDTMSYTAPMLERDKKVLEAWKVPFTVEVRPDWAYDFPRPSLPTIAAWVDGVWPPGEYRAKATAVEEALKAKDVPGAAKAHADLLLELKKTPYPAYDARAVELGKAVLDLGRTLVSDAKALVEADPLEAVARMEAAVKATKGLKPVDAEATAALAALKKDPKVTAAVRKKEAEALAVTYIGRADAAEAKGDLAKALEWFKKAAALGDTSKKAEADAKVAELEAKVGGK